ncbi:hypothetical protein Tco_1203210 [Tanacetum coccineum]
MTLTAYADADHEQDVPENRRSTSGSLQFLGDKLVRWSSKKQTSTSISSIKCQEELLLQHRLVTPGQNTSTIPTSFHQETSGKREVVELYFGRTEYNWRLLVSLAHTLHAKPRENEFESFSGQCLSEYIRQLILCPHEITTQPLPFPLVSLNEMMSDVEVFRPVS